MAARPSPDDYSIPTRWVPVSGELSRGRCLTSLSETERLIFYNQDVLYHQNLEILQMLDELRAQNKHASPESTTNLQNQTLKEAESKQRSVIEMQQSRVPSVRLPTAFKDELPTPSTRSPRRNAEGKRNADNLDSGKDEEREMGGNFSGGAQPGKKQKLTENPKAKVGDVVPDIGFGFPKAGGNDNDGSASPIDPATPFPSSFLTNAASPGVNIFGAAQSIGSDASQCRRTGFMPLEPYRERESGGWSSFSHFQSINFMDVYRKFSFEELRLADYDQGRKYGPWDGGSGVTSPGAATAFGSFGKTNSGFSGGNNNNTTGDFFSSKAAIDNTPSKPATSVFGAVPGLLPTWNNGFVLGAEGSLKSTANDTPSKLATNFFGAAAAALSTRGHGFGLGSEKSLKPATNIFSKQSAAVTPAPAPAAASPSEPTQIENDHDMARARVSILDEISKADSFVKDCEVHSFTNKQNGKIRTFINQQAENKVFLDTALMRTVNANYTGGKDGIILRASSNDGESFTYYINGEDDNRLSRMSELMQTNN